MGELPPPFKNQIQILTLFQTMIQSYSKIYKYTLTGIGSKSPKGFA